MEIGLMCVFRTNTEKIACAQFPLPLRKYCCTWAAEIIENWHVVIELTSVKKGLSPFPFFYICVS